jgi:RimJ/RimL family protein N-acetyltransferase
MVEIESACNGRPGLAALEESDGQLLAGFFARLSPASVYRRFFSPALSEERFIASILRQDGYERAAIAAVDLGEVVGVVQYSRRSGCDEADLAIVIADAWQRQGLGTRLVAALGEQAASHGISRFAVNVQGDNYGVLRLLNRVAPGLRLSFSGGVGEGVFALASCE